MFEFFDVQVERFSLPMAMAGLFNLTPGLVHHLTTFSISAPRLVAGHRTI